MFKKRKEFKYLCCEISSEYEENTQHKLTKFYQTLGFLNNTLKPNLVQKFSRIKECNALALSIL